jgi:hypothetical protein
LLKYKAKSIALMRPHVQGPAKLVETSTGEFVTRYTDAHGNELYSERKGRASEYMDTDEFVSRMRGSEDFAGGFEGQSAPGSGGHGSEGGTHSANGHHTITSADARDHSKYIAAKAAAGEAGAQLVILED